MKILIAAAECAPFVKTGGLADVVGALPKYLQRLGHEVRLILPLHQQIKNKYAGQLQHLCSFSVDLGWRSHYAGLEWLEAEGLSCYFIDNEYYFGTSVYRGGLAEGEQYCFFSRAIAEALPVLAFEPDILHLNDWHTAVLPLLLKTQYSGRRNPKTLLTIHNLAYQGQFPLDFAADLLGIAPQYLTPQYMEFYGTADFLKAGCVFADKLNTVSPTYAREILDEPAGEGLSGVLRARGADLVGILNGLDTEVFDPATDKALPLNYDANSRIEVHSRNKHLLLDELGLDICERPLLAMVTRLAEQKGLDILLEAADELFSRDLSLVILGNGEPRYEQALRELETRHKGRCCSWIGYRDDIGRRIYAGCDFYLMPSRFEPCGLSQLIALRYGALPIVRECGGLSDTVIACERDELNCTGFAFREYTAEALLASVDRALAVYAEPQRMQQMTDRAMRADFSFERAAGEYEQLYRSILEQ